MIIQKKFFEGKVVFMRSKDDDSKCVCCEGNHIFARYVDFKEKHKEIIEEMLKDFTGKDKEGRKVIMEVRIKMDNALSEDKI